MASPAVSTPSSAGSPAPATLAPAPQTLALKPLTASSNPSTPSIVTQKEWVIPPRPKPGRKPATDTPPTKRKAQNRAAQRAFRERRAARVGELEEQLEEEKTGYERREQELLGRVARLEEELRRAGTEVERWRVRSYTVEGMLEWERAEKQRVVEELEILRFGSRSVGTEAVPLPSRRTRNQVRQEQQHQQEVNREAEEQYATDIVIGEADMAAGCGNCTATSSCACMEQAIASVTAGCGNCTPGSNCECSDALLKGLDTVTTESINESDLKRPHSPASNDRPEESKRQRQQEPTTPLEIDFTSQFARPSPKKEEPSLQDTAPIQPIPTRAAQIEPCGFCKDGSYCACADMANAASLSQNPTQQAQSSLLNNENRLPPLLHEVTPPPSDTDVTASEINGKLPVWQPKSMHRAVSLPAPLKTKANPCANGPGTCEQCLSDPRSGMFCRSLAKLREQNGNNSDAPGSAPSGCCGGNANGGGCCMDKKTPTTNSTSPTATSMPTQGIATTSNPPPTLSCAQAYQTLSTHTAFERATESSELNTWLPRLSATPTDESVIGTGQIQGNSRYEGRTSNPGPLEVEAASVMEVLKFFDRRFGRG